MDTIEINGWQGRLGLGLAPRQLEATLYAAQDLTMKEAARRMGISPATVKQALDDARFKLGKYPNCIRSVRGLCLEAMKRGIIAPLVLLLCMATGLGTIDHNVRRPVRAPKVAVRYVARQEVA